LISKSVAFQGQLRAIFTLKTIFLIFLNKKMSLILKEGKYPNGSFKSRETELHDQPGQRVILKESWYLPQADPLNPWQATDNAQQSYGKQQYKENHMNGQQHGVQEYWYRDGQQCYKFNYVNGQQHGVQESWHDNGQQQYKFNYVNGKRHGVQEYWYPSGVDPSDPWQATDAARQRGGQQWCKLNYVNGQQHGVQESWRGNGQQWNKLNYVNGQQHGIQEGWYEDGQLESRKYYLDGIEVSQQVYKSYVEGLAPEVQATIDFEEPNLSKVIAMYLLP
jgi:antitoxin component YwqK of YwqJK toxin-antitoxin module